MGDKTVSLYDQWKTASPYDDEIPEEYFDVRHAIAEWHGVECPHPESEEASSFDFSGVELKIEKAIYKYNTPNILINFDPFCAGIVELQGYSEGDNGELPIHTITWPFTKDEYFEIFDLCNNEAIERWESIEHKKALED